MDDPELLAIISRRLAKGEPEEAIKTDLLAKGHDPFEVNGAYAKAKLHQLPIFAGQYLATSAPARKPYGGVLFNLLVIVLFLCAVPAACEFYADAIAPAVRTLFIQARGSKESAETAPEKPFGVVPLIPTSTAPRP